MSLTRRKLFQTGLGVGAGLVAAAPSMLSAVSKSRGDSALRVAFIGCGKQQEVLFHAMRNIPGIRCVAVCDIMENRRDRAARRIRAQQGDLPPGYLDAGEMLAAETDLDAVIVCTPDFWHAPHTIMALEAGCHVYCEKMMADTIEGARSIVRAVEKSGLLCQIGHQRRSNPRYLHVFNELIHGGNILGHIVNINGQWNRSLSASQDIAANPMILPEADILRRYGFAAGAEEASLDEEALRHRFLNWRFYKALSGGPISDLGAHQIDIYNWFMGRPPVSVMASGGRNHFHDREHFDNVMCVFQYDTPEGGTRAFYQVLTTTSAGGGYHEAFMGTEGTVQISERAAYTNIWREGGSDRLWHDHVREGRLNEVAPMPVPEAGANTVAAYASAAPEAFDLPVELSKPPHQPHLENFFAAIRGEAKLTCDARTAFASEAPVFWINPAAEAGETMHFTPAQLEV